MSEKDKIITAGGEGLKVITGRGIGGVIVYRSGGEDIPEAMSLNPVRPGEVCGMQFSYSQVHEVVVNNEPVWVNWVTHQVPHQRQDVKDGGKLTLKLFDSEELRQFVKDNNFGLLELGLIFSF